MVVVVLLRRFSLRLVAIWCGRSQFLFSSVVRLSRLKLFGEYRVSKRASFGAVRPFFPLCLCGDSLLCVCTGFLVVVKNQKHLR